MPIIKQEKQRLDYKSTFNISAFLLVLLVLSCGDLPHDNMLDPKNPDSIAPQKVMIEAFVNTNNPSNVNQYALQALNSLLTSYGDRIVIAEYHRNTAEYTDPYHLEKNELLYQHYISQFDNLKAVPDIFINGTNQRVQGASSASYSLFRLEQALTEEIVKNNYYLIEIDYSRNGDTIRPKIHLARLGKGYGRDIVIKAVIVSDISSPYLQRVVHSSVESNVISVLSPGEQRDLELPEMSIDVNFVNTLIVYITGSTANYIYQCESGCVR